MPDPRAFTTIAFVVAPIVSLMAGILEFVFLDGSTAFPVLAISLAPFIIGSALLMTLPNQTHVSPRAAQSGLYPGPSRAE